MLACILSGFFPLACLLREAIAGAEAVGGVSKASNHAIQLQGTGRQERQRQWQPRRRTVQGGTPYRQEQEQGGVSTGRSTVQGGPQYREEHFTGRSKNREEHNTGRQKYRE